ncbi:MAG: hypothetical protein SGARI_005170 [Bacillariaceae sp.]
MLGDFGNTEREAFTTGFSVILLVVYSFLVTVILLNVLIAIASDSYEKCLLKSRKLFGRARVMLVAELVSFQSLLRKRDPREDLPTKEEKGEDLYVSIVSSLSSVFVNIALYITIIVVLDRGAAAARREADGRAEWSNSVQRFVLRVLGASRDGAKDLKSLRKKRRGQEEWHGRVQYLQRELEQHGELQNQAMIEQSENFLKMLSQSESRLKSELSGIEERFRETNDCIVSAVNELKALISLGGSTAPGIQSPVPNEVDIDFHN